MSTQPSAARRADLSSYAAGWQARERARQKKETEWRTRIEARLPQVVRMLAKDFGATRVLLFGRHARGEAGPESDVDLLVEGLPLARIILETAVDRFVLHVTIGMPGQLRLSEASPSG